MRSLEKREGVPEGNVEFVAKIHIQTTFIVVVATIRLSFMRKIGINESSLDMTGLLAARVELPPGRTPDL